MSDEDRRIPDASDVVPPETVSTVEELETLLLGRPASMGRRQVSREAQVSVLSARKFWHALGFPLVADHETMFTEADLTALKQVSRLVREEQVDEQLALAMTRAIARTSDRLAVWQTQLLAEAVTPPEEVADLSDVDSRAVPSLEVAETAARRLAGMADELEPLLIYVWRRHLSAAISRMLADAAPEDPAAGTHRSVGFADLVSFTSVVRRLTERQLAHLVQRFELLASDIVTAHGGRIIKTVGDEVMFVTIGAAPAAAVALDLVDAMSGDEMLPDVRVGMAYGPVISRLGDVFGTTVNRASRLTSVAPHGGVLVDDALTKGLAETSGFEMVPQPTRTLRGIGSVTTSLLHRSRGERRTDVTAHP